MPNTGAELPTYNAEVIKCIQANKINANIVLSVVKETAAFYFKRETDQQEKKTQTKTDYHNIACEIYRVFPNLQAYFQTLTDSANVTNKSAKRVKTKKSKDKTNLSERESSEEEEAIKAPEKTNYLKQNEVNLFL